MNPIVRAGLAMFTLGLLVGASATWHAARALERFRRDRADLRATVDQARGLGAKVSGQVVTLARLAGYAMLAAGVLVAIIAARR